MVHSVASKPRGPSYDLVTGAFLWNIYFLKMGQSRPLFLFIFVFSTCYNLNSNWKKRRWCAWDLNPGRQDGRHKRIHWATAAPQRPYHVEHTSSRPTPNLKWSCFNSSVIVSGKTPIFSSLWCGQPGMVHLPSPRCHRGPSGIFMLLFVKFYLRIFCTVRSLF